MLSSLFALFSLLNADLTAYPTNSASPHLVKADLGEQEILYRMACIQHGGTHVNLSSAFGLEALEVLKDKACVSSQSILRRRIFRPLSVWFGVGLPVSRWWVGISWNYNWTPVYSTQFSWRGTQWEGF